MRILKNKLSELSRRHAIALICTALSIFLIALTWIIEVERHKRMSTFELAEIRAKLESEISISTYPIEGLANAILMHQGNINYPEIQKYSESMHSLSPALLSLQFAPDAIVRISSRPVRDAKAIGHDLLADNSRRPEVIRSIRQRRTILAGPLELMQGGTAIIARKPIFVEGWNSPTGIKDFYGFVTAIIDPEFIFKNTMIDWSRFALRGRHGLGEAGEVFYGATKIFDKETLNMPIRLPNGNWILATPKPGIQDFLPEIPLIVLFTIIISAFIVAMAKRIRLRQEQAERDAEKLSVASKIGNLGFIEKLDDGSISMSAGAKRILEVDNFDALTPKIQDAIKNIFISFHQINLKNDTLNILHFESPEFGKKTLELLITSNGNIISVLDITNVSKRIEHDINLSKLASIGELATGVAHELNTPLQYITDNLHFLRTTVSRLAINHTSNGTYNISEETARDLMDEFPSAIDDCADGTERMSRIIAAMKSYAAPDDTIPAQNLSIPKIIESAIVLTAGAHKHLATISFDQASEPFYVAGRENELTQVFINLINNSCDAIRDRFAGQNSSPNGEIKIMLEKIGGRLKITYKDNGGGIPEEISRRIFDLFFTTKPIGKGTGQGLAISLAIIKRFNGDIYYKPAPPDGSMFIIELDLAKEMPVEASDLVSC